MRRKMRKITGFVLMVCMIVSLFAGVTSAFAAKAFKDVPDSHWSKTYVDFVVDKGYFAGVSEDRFDPDGKMTRAMFVAVIAKVEGKTFDNAVDSGFTDVPAGKYYTGAVKWAAENEIVSGIGNKRYGPDLPITRQDICVMMDKYIQYHDANNKEKYLDRDTSVTFKDASDISSYAKDSVEKCVSYGLIQGYPDGKFYPKRNASRAEVAVMIYRLALYIENDSFKANYKFVSGTDGKKLDSKVEALLPSDANSYKNGETVKAVAPAETEVMTDDGVWSFAGYDKKEAKIDKANVTFTGTWTFTAADTKEYSAEYKFVSGTKDVELPAALTSLLLPQDSATYLNGEKVKAIEPALKEYTTLQGRWQFVGYDKTEAKVDHANVVFTGTWERSPLIPETFAVQYVFKTDDGKDVPDVVNNAKPTPAARVQNGTEVVAQAPRSTSVVDGKDTWTFVSYDKEKATVNSADVIFTGTWKKTVTAKYKVTYKNQINATIEVPEAVQKELDSRLPKVKEYDNGSTVALETPLQGTYTTKEGTWRYIAFGDILQNLTRSVVIRDQDVEVTWIWALLIPSRTYSVNYEYGTEGIYQEDLRAIEATLPTDDARYYSGDEAIVQQPAKVLVEDSNRKGAYVFNGWDDVEKDQKTVEIDDANITLTGSWEYNAYNSVTYVNDPAAVPVNVPKDNGKYIKGDKVTVKAPEKTSVEKDGKLYSYKGAYVDGKEVTSGTAIMPGTDLTIVHIWEEAKYSIVEFEAVSVTAGQNIPDEVKSIMPKPLNGKEKGSKVEGVKPEKTKVEVDGGYWVWQGYKEAYITVSKNVETFHGEWKFVKTYTATFEYDYADAASRTEGMPGAVIATLPDDDNTLESGKAYTPKKPNNVPADAGTWVFQGWNPEKVDSVSGNQKFVGKWKFTANK